jgi:hypothetical protein
MKTLSRAVAALSVALTALVIQTTPASALSCVHPSEWYPEAKHVFVGRISDVRGDGIELEVREVWQGPDLADRVWLQRSTGMDMWFPFSRDGRVPDGYSSPKEYVVATQGDLVLGPCSLAEVGGDTYGVKGADTPRPPVVSEELAGTPEEATAAPPPGASEGDGSAAPLAAGGVGAVGLGALSALVWRRRRSS